MMASVVTFITMIPRVTTGYYSYTISELALE